MISPPCRGKLLFNESAYVASLALFTIGVVVSAAVTGAIVGFVGALLQAWLPSLRLVLAVFIGVISLIYSFAEVTGKHLPLPTRQWQVPQEWGRYGSVLFALAFGLTLGPGFLTFVTFVGYYSLLLICLLVADPLQAAFLMAIYGFARAVPVLFAPAIAWIRNGSSSVKHVAAINDWLMSLYGRLTWIRALILLAIAGVALIYSAYGAL